MSRNVIDIMQAVCYSKSVTKRDKLQKGGLDKMVPYGKRLIQLRGSRSQETVAKAVGISTSAYGMYEIEQRIPRDEIKIALAKYYDTTVEAIFFAPESHVT